MTREKNPLPITFYQRTALELAPALLGCLLVKETDEGTASGYIVETEAYMGAGDRAAHSFNNRRTKRTEIMFAEAGRVYTYVMHTHTLLNVVAAEADVPQAVLIRAIEPHEGQLLMEERRTGRHPREWTNGPGKLTKALGVTMNDYGRWITEQPLYIEGGYTPEDISTGPRIGIDNSGEARDYPWRFWVTGNRYVSR
ncbi:DNA-3-methyladenine glycosylase [Bacillus spizizenii]|uniref:Putative 3-methyladenine DNA glycosylase n=1 Tax=Bacillus spizizenii TaxID=96241 RepID=A0A9Q4DLN4_BACSC|nr:DNA-3-methyladenine glycosylase [Bacillus spizizenii]MBK4204992.1 DNA-3-methyladenine glycosylase [Bacillus subtilis]MCY7866208.1 DNA-3-methyladenine glycosylase [Bacillus spizizenii]MCY8120219.1 DNA-3-methyladenine glycosylase [Bacillus spizizenii]MEC0628847.1 DNA-3-methyladenine glycosylase [Bacillus spizizenii]MEC1528868.1 DNA-3-methyladenine glycosylase [Bacillus spizizenii]